MQTDGRPTIYSQEILDSVVQFVKDRHTRESAALESGISLKTFYNWMNRGKAGEPPFVDFYTAVKQADKEAQAKRKQDLLEQIRRVGAGEHVEMEEEITEHSEKGTITRRKKKYCRPEWTANAWRLEREFPDEFGKDTEFIRDLKQFLALQKKLEKEKEKGIDPDAEAK